METGSLSIDGTVPNALTEKFIQFQTALDEILEELKTLGSLSVMQSRLVGSTLSYMSTHSVNLSPCYIASRRNRDACKQNRWKCNGHYSCTIQCAPSEYLGRVKQYRYFLCMEGLSLELSIL